jgi:hypothetical protein
MRTILLVVIGLLILYPIVSVAAPPIMEEDITGIINVDDYGAIGNDDKDDSKAILKACKALKGNTALRFSAGNRYIIAEPIDCSVPNHSVVIAYGAHLLFPNDVGGINLNPDANPDSPESGILRMFRWLGGRLENTAEEKTASYGLRVFAGRNIIFQDMHIQGFFHGIEYAARDTFVFSDIHFYDNVVHIYQPNWIRDGSITISTTVDRCHFSINAATGSAVDESAIAVYGGWSNFVISNSSFNGAVGGSNEKAAIYLTHQAAPKQSPTAFTLENSHFEQGDSHHPYLWLDELEGRAFVGVRINGNFFNYGNLKPAVRLEKVRNVEFEGNRFAQTENAGGIPIEIDGNSRDVHIARSNFFSTAAPLFHMPREEITFEPSFRRVPHVPLENYNGAILSSSTVKVVMRDEFSSFPEIANPTGYWLNIQAGSVGPSKVIVRKSDGINEWHGCLLDLEEGNGWANPLGTTCYVPADVNGDFVLDVFASPEGSVMIWIAVTGFSM